MNQIPVLQVNTLVILRFLIELDVLELLLELESITHLIKQKGNHDFTEASVRLKPLSLYPDLARVELVAEGK